VLAHTLQLIACARAACCSRFVSSRRLLALQQPVCFRLSKYAVASLHSEWLQEHMHHCCRKREAAHAAVAAWLHATAGRAWRSWRTRVQQSTAKRGAASAALAAWRIALAARCWRAWSGRAAHRRLLTQRATSFICELLSVRQSPFAVVHDRNSAHVRFSRSCRNTMDGLVAAAAPAAARECVSCCCGLREKTLSERPSGTLQLCIRSITLMSPS
jgi:hypothetical protein